MYFNEINNAFKFFGLSPRDNQVDIVNDILIAFIQGKKKFVVLNAPTGIGKSVIGAVVARCVEQMKLIKEDEDVSSNPAMFLVGTNTLTTQYADSFKGNRDFLLAKGANNYKCGLMTEKENKYHDGESCASSLYKQMVPKLYEKHCDSCEFNKIKSLRNKVPYLITNYSMFFINQLYSQIIKTRGLTIFDEAHTINDLFVEHMSINQSAFMIKRYQNELMEIFVQEKYIDGLGIFRKLIEEGKITDRNYHDYIPKFQSLYKGIADNIENKMVGEKDLSMLTKYRKLYKKFAGQKSKLDDFITFDYDHIFEAKEGEISIKPVFVNLFFKGIASSPYNLLMSATISEDLVEYMLGLEPDDYEFIRAEPVFDPKNKKVVFLEPISLGYKSLQEPKTIQEIDKRVVKILKANKHHKGIILVPSFKLGKEVAAAIRKSGVKITLFEHSYGEKLQDYLMKFKACKEPAVLVSPSLFEGIDLAGDLSRWQIIVKAPYPSLGDKRIKHILDKYPIVYELSTVLKLVQGVGRSVRSKEDHAVTYILDSNAKRIFKGKENTWKNEFHMVDEKL